MTTPAQLMRVKATEKESLAAGPNTPEGKERADKVAEDYLACADILERIETGELIPVPRGLIEEYLELLDGAEYSPTHAFVRKRAAETLLNVYELKDTDNEVQSD